MLAEIPRLETLRKQLQDGGYTHAVLLGMGGSSLAPEVFSKIFKDQEKGLNVAILDSTDPDAILDQADHIKIQKTIFIVSTKSGGTVETLSLFKFFYNQVLAKLGKDQAGMQFIAITDPGSKLETLAQELEFRDIFLNDPNIGGRFSVLSFFGLVPAALVGVDISKLLRRAIKMAKNCQTELPIEANPGAVLGAILGSFNQIGRDKVTFVISPQIESFGDWVEQLIAESTGKEGTGILPVVGENLLSSNFYGDDRIFVYLHLSSDKQLEQYFDELQESGQPVLKIQLDDPYDIGAQFFLWEFATVISSYFLKINPFDQPNVESAKIQARKRVAEFEKTGRLPTVESAAVTPQSLHSFMMQAKPGDYVAIQAYVNPTDDTHSMLKEIRQKLLKNYHIATTLGFGPRFLHSTGQLHKGDAGNGLFIQILSKSNQIVSIPEQPGSDSSNIDFQTLKISQALGDAAALKDAGRRLIRFVITDQNEINHLS
jgi:glucose-6-phosphate isomerase